MSCWKSSTWILLKLYPHQLNRIRRSRRIWDRKAMKKENKWKIDHTENLSEAWFIWRTLPDLTLFTQQMHEQILFWSRRRTLAPGETGATVSQRNKELQYCIRAEETKFERIHRLWLRRRHRGSTIVLWKRLNSGWKTNQLKIQKTTDYIIINNGSRIYHPLWSVKRDYLLEKTVKLYVVLWSYRDLSTCVL